MKKWNTYEGQFRGEKQKPVMVKFVGEIDKDIELFVMNKQRRILVKPLSIALSICVLGFGALLLFVENIPTSGIILCLILIQSLILGICAVVIPIRETNVKWNYNITTTDQKIILEIVRLNGTIMHMSPSKVKKVIDYGKFYHILFSQWSMRSSVTDIVCQKNLLTEGTLDEFESLFASKLKRKTRR